MLKLRKCDLEAYHVWKSLKHTNYSLLCPWLSGIFKSKVTEFMYNEELIGCKITSKIRILQRRRFLTDQHVVKKLYINSTMDDILDEYNV